MKQITITLLVIIIFQTFVNGAKVDTVNIYSNSMQKQIKCVVVKPISYKKKNTRFPVIYLLHGYSGDYSNWIKKVPEIKSYADEYNIIIVCPDGDYASWYFDSPLDPKMKYETYISFELPHYIDSTFRTIADKNYRAITGLSMGGHGALFIAWKHPQVFAAVGSMSGGVDLNDLKNKYQITKVLGDTLNYPDNWKNYSVLNVIENKLSDSLEIIIDDGNDDIFIAANRRLHQKLLQLKIPHDYIERPGKHSWDYWKYALNFQILFFKKYFDAQDSKHNLLNS